MIVLCSLLPCGFDSSWNQDHELTNLVLIVGSCASPRGSRFYQGFGVSHLQDVADPQLSVIAIHTMKDRANIEERIATCGRSPLIIDEDQ